MRSLRESNKNEKTVLKSECGFFMRFKFVSAEKRIKKGEIAKLRERRKGELWVIRRFIFAISQK